MDNTTNTLAEQSKLRRLVNSYGVPRLIITGFLLLMFILAPVAGVDFATQITNVINRFSWNAIMVLAMVPMIHSGCGLNFGLPLGIISGLLGATLSIEFGFTGGMSFLMAIVIATPFALVLGGGYGWMLNKIKGGEMMVATYVGFSSVSFMCMMWLLLPYKSPTMVWGFAGKGLRTTISLEGFYDQFLAKFLQIDLNRFGINLVIPTGSLLFFALLAFLLPEAELVLPGADAAKMLEQCDQVVLMACTLGTQFETLLRREQARDMSRAVILAACGSAWVEAGCDQVEQELAHCLPNRYRTDRFSPGYGDLPLSLQPKICAALDTQRRLGLYVTESYLMNPSKSVTAIIGLSDWPQMARIRGCAYCSMRETCKLRVGGKHCGN